MTSVALEEKPNTYRVLATTQAHSTIRNVLLCQVLPNLLASLQSLLHTSVKIAGSSWHTQIDDSNWETAAGELHSQNLHSWRRMIQGQSQQKVKCIWTSFLHGGQRCFGFWHLKEKGEAPDLIFSVTKEAHHTHWKAGLAGGELGRN